MQAERLHDALRALLELSGQRFVAVGGEELPGPAQLFDLIDNKIDQNLIGKLYSTQLMKKGEKSLLDNDRYYYKLLRRIVTRGQEKGELTTQMTVNEIVRLYAMCERALIIEWCLCNWSFSLKNFAEQSLPLLLNGIRK